MMSDSKIENNDYAKFKELITKLNEDTDTLNNTVKIIEAYERLQNNDPNYLKEIENSVQYDEYVRSHGIDEKNEKIPHI